jgi:hypothetical protein
VCACKCEGVSGCVREHLFCMLQVQLLMYGRELSISKVSTSTSTSLSLFLSLFTSPAGSKTRRRLPVRCRSLVTGVGDFCVKI